MWDPRVSVTRADPALASLDKWKRPFDRLEARFPSGKAYFHLTTARNTFSLLRRRIQLNVLSVFQLRGLFVELFLQIGP